MLLVIASSNGPTNSGNISDNSKNGEIIRELNKILMLSQQKKERPKGFKGLEILV